MVIAFAALPVQADPKARLDQFIDGTQALRAQFTQTVFDARGRKTQEASGTLFLSRPGKFRWVYARPYQQLIVGDGRRIWIHDQDLEQVTVRPMDAAIGESPAALLAGSNDIDTHFTLRDGGTRNGLAWLEATPRGQEGSFQRVRMGFRGNDLVAMELHDNFGQTTHLRFSALERNPSLAASLFRFTPPRGVNVIGDE